MRRDLADVFCTTTEGVRAERARQWKLVDHVAKPQVFKDAIRQHAANLARQSGRPGAGKGESPDVYASAFIWEGNGGPLLISPGNDFCTAHQLTDGAEVAFFPPVTGG